MIATTPQLPPQSQHPPPIDWTARAEQVRQEQWKTAQELIDTSELLLRHLRAHPERPKASITSQITRLLQLANQLRRQATGLDLKKKDPGPTGPPPLSPELQAEVDRIYGEPPATPGPTPPQSAAPTPPANPAPPPTDPSIHQPTNPSSSTPPAAPAPSAEGGLPVNSHLVPKVQRVTLPPLGPTAPNSG